MAGSFLFGYASGYFGVGSGRGYVAGTDPVGLVSINGVPGAREVEIRHRITRTVVATTFSHPDGTYLFRGVDPEKEFDIIGRDWQGIYNDAIIARVRPEPYDVQSATGTFDVNDVAKTLDGGISIVGGLPGHTVDVVDGTEPTGITFSVVTGGPPEFDAVSRWLVASGTADAGTYTWTLRVTAPNGTFVDVACTATFT